jgi:hypothetical protein
MTTNKTERRDHQVTPLPGEVTLENARQKAEHFAVIERLALEKLARSLSQSTPPAKK